MCTLSVVTREDGFLLGMNRDERLDRGPAAPPRRFSAGGIDAVYPVDVKGGAWIAVNELGMAYALLNRHGRGRQAPPPARERSRGLVIPELVHLTSIGVVEARMNELPLDGLPPFRLVGVFPADRQFREWNWDGERLSAAEPRWGSRHWFSSGLSDEKAEAIRSSVCRKDWMQEDAGAAAWLARLHSSHENGPGPFSICVHREDVQTVSYTSVECSGIESSGAGHSGQGIRLAYFPGPPCAQTGIDRGLSRPWQESLANERSISLSGLF